MKVEQFLSHFDNVKRVSENKYQALCPSHSDKKRSLSITEKEDRILIKCHAGCTAKDVLSQVNLELADLFLKKNKKNVGSDASKSLHSCTGGCSLQDYSKNKKIPLSFLEKIGLRDSRYRKKVSLVIPYPDEEGNTICKRYRTSLTGDDKFRWEKGAKVVLYGLNRLERAREKGYIVIVEGESDCHTLWYKRFPAIGLPVASTWNEERDAGFLKGIEKIYAVLEPDQGGETLKQMLAKSFLADRIRVLNLGEHKDPSALYLSSPDEFKANFREAMKSATRLKGLLDGEANEKRKEAWRLCKEIATNEDILSLFSKDLFKLGMVGEKKLAKALYLALTTRYLGDPVCIAIKGGSSTGKSFVAGSVLPFFPPSAYYMLSSSSEKALIYSDESFEHRFVIFFEAEGIKGKFQEYIIRTLISEKRIIYEVTETDKEGRFKTRRIVKEGPTGFITTTTRLNLHAENETRHISFVTNDTTKQTEKILMATAEAENGEGKQIAFDYSRWQAYPTWLGYNIRPVLIPYAKTLARLFDARTVRIRRDFKKVLQLIKAHALIHQKNRDTDEEGRIIATFEDYFGVYWVVADAIGADAESSVPKRIRETVVAVKQMIKEKDVDERWVSIAELTKKLKVDRSTAQRRVSTAINRGFLKNLEDRKGMSARIVLDEPMPQDEGILPKPWRLKKEYKASEKQEK